MKQTPHVPLLLVSVFIIATCGILYELLISTISTYFLGSSILHFSITIGLFMSAMGIGSYLSKFIDNQLLEKFIFIEIVLGLAGGLSATFLYFAYTFTHNYHLVAFFVITGIGTLIGLEIPLVTRLIQQRASFKDAVAQVLSFDYIGALAASIIFPLLLLPYLGVMRTAFLVGLLNLAVAAINAYVFAAPRRLYVGAWVGMALLTIGFLNSFRIVGFFEKFLYHDEIIFSKQSAYQKIVLTKWNEDMRLYINGNLQFSTVDEYRYHEALVHIPMAATPRHEKVLVLGGGDGLAAREILKWPDCQQVTIVDLDSTMTNLARWHPLFQQLNKGSMQNRRLNVVNADAFKFLEQNSEKYNCILIDLPDPSDAGLSKLYTVEFYELVQKSLTADGVFVTQATSPFFAREAFWCIRQSVAAAVGSSTPYQAYVPSFGLWGFVLGGSPKVAQLQQRLQRQPFATRYLNKQNLQTPFTFEADVAEIPTQPNTLENQRLTTYYNQGANQWE